VLCCAVLSITGGRKRHLPTSSILSGHARKQRTTRSPSHDPSTIEGKPSAARAQPLAIPQIPLYLLVADSLKQLVQGPIERGDAPLHNWRGKKASGELFSRFPLLSYVHTLFSTFVALLSPHMSQQKRNARRPSSSTSSVRITADNDRSLPIALVSSSLYVFHEGQYRRAACAAKN